MITFQTLQFLYSNQHLFAFLYMVKQTISFQQCDNSQNKTFIFFQLFLLTMHTMVQVHTQCTLYGTNTYTRSHFKLTVQNIRTMHTMVQVHTHGHISNFTVFILKSQHLFAHGKTNNFI